jgi:Listeria/Bacterioides repeat
MVKKLFSIVLILVITLCSLAVPGMAAGTLTLSASSVSAGDTVTASGISPTSAWVAVKLLDSNGNIIFYDNVRSGATGEYSCTFKVPSSASGTLTVIAGYGSNVASASLNAAQSAITYTVTFKDLDGTVLKTQTVNEGSAATAPGNPTRTGYTFTGWNQAFNNVTSNLTVTAEYSQNSSGNGSGSGDTTTETPPETQKTETKISGTAAIATTTTTGTIDNSGKATAAVTQAQISEAVRKAAEEAAKQENGSTVVVKIKVEADTAAKTVEVILPKTAVDAVVGSNVATLMVSTPVADITFDHKALDTIAGQAAADVKISAAKVEAGTLSDETKQVVGDRPVFNFSVTIGGNTISQFGGNVSVSVPYTPKDGEDTNAIVIYFINAQGKPEMVSNCKFVPVLGSVIFSTNHFSQYAVGYNPVSFKDVAADAWYNKAVGFIAARRITLGSGSGNYSPEAKLTRGQFLVMMMRAYGVKPDENPKDNFADAGSTYYTGYLAAAKRLGISGGIGNNMFAPDKEITRQEMFTLLYNVLKGIGELPEGKSGKQLSDFSDTGQIASWAKEAMTLLMETGTIGGNAGKLTPTKTTTRAEMAQVMYNLLSKQEQ